MNSNLRNMIEDALDGGLSHEETYSYNSDVDMSHVYGDGEIEKLASALNYVATNLDDLGTTDEKLAELELLQEKIATGEAEAAKATTEAAEDTFTAFGKNLKGDSGVSLGKAFGNLSTARKVAVGGGAGLVGLGALYGGYKMLGGGSQPNTQVVKVSSLQDAKAIALTKMAQQYDIPVSDLEKIALSKTQASILNIGEDKALTEKQIAILRGNVEEGIMAGRPRQVKLFGDLKAGDKMTGQLRTELLTTLQANPTDIKMINNPEAVKANASRIRGGAETARTTRALESKAVASRNVGAAKDFKNMPTQELFSRIKNNMSGLMIDDLNGAQKKDLIKAVRGDAEALSRLNVATGQDYSGVIKNINPNFDGGLQSKVTRSQASQSFLGNDRYNSRQSALTAKGAGEGSATSLAEARVGDYSNQAKATSTAGKDAKAKFEALSESEQKKLTQRYNKQKTKGSGGRANISTGQTGYAVDKGAGQAAEKELGFLTKNRRALLGAGALGAAGLAGYGAYKAFGGGGQNKAASYRGMRKIAEDRINPARIKAGAAHRFSGMDIHAPGMSRSASPYEPIGIKAQRIRDTINRDMKGYVNHVGGGYNLDNYLNRFNK